MHQEKSAFRSPYTEVNNGARVVLPDGDVYSGYWYVGYEDSYGRSPGLIEHSTEGDVTDTAWYVNSSGNLLNPNPGMMGEMYSIANVRYSYGIFKIL